MDDILNKVEETTGVDLGDIATGAVDSVAEMIKEHTPDALDGTIDAMKEKVSDVVESMTEGSEHSAEAAEEGADASEEIAA